MNHKILAIICCVLLYACGGNKKKKECLEYFDAHKEEVETRQKKINSILDTLTDAPESQDDPAYLELAKQEMEAPAAQPATGPTFAPAEVFVIAMESIGNKENWRKLAENDARLPLYRKEIGDQVIAFGEKVRSGKKDCYTGAGVNRLKELVEAFTKVKYLAVTDCVFYIRPGERSNEEFMPGAMVKQVRVFDIASGKEVKRSVITAVSSETVTSKNYEVTKLDMDLLANISRNFIKEIFAAEPAGLEHFNDL